MSNCHERIRKLRNAMIESGVDIVLLSPGSDLEYFTGYQAMPSERLTVLVVRADDSPVMFVPALEAPRVEPGLFEVRSWAELEDPVDLATATATKPALVAVGDHMWSVFLTRFQKTWSHTSWIPASELTWRMRALKDTDEIALLRQAAHAVDRVMGRIGGEVRFSGRAEADIARDLSEFTVAEGHDLAAFAIVASGPNGASPHHHPGERVVREGDLVVCDFGGRLGGYYSDSTRTFAVGSATPDQVSVHEIVSAANEAGRKAVRAGVPCEEIDRAARFVVTEAGYGDYFIHRTGHGIGLEVHEHPYMVEGNETPLEAGMTFSVEPGIYLPDEFGVRIEDIVVCTEDGVESLNGSPRELIEVG